MKISKRQLKRIIREEYSRLKRKGLIREMFADERSTDDAGMADIILDMWDEGAEDLDTAIDMAFEGQGLTLPDIGRIRRILQIVERQWGSRVTELNISNAIDDYLAFYETY